MLFINAVN